ncbi:MAG TPA: MarR family transcriptional regulator [Enterococcus columbae]|nr:MarR family transcriptional regulator [Enterococcus columbae]
MSKTTLSAMLKRLEAQGLISSYQDVIDSRKNNIHLLN